MDVDPTLHDDPDDDDDDDGGGGGGSALRRAWNRARAVLPDEGRIAVLHLGDRQVSVFAGAREAAEPGPPIRFDTGIGRLVERHFARGLPTALGLESAIETVEDAVMSLAAGIAGTARLWSTDPSLRAIARAAGHAPGADARLELDAIERVFDRLAARALGRPLSQDTLPKDGDFAAALVIVRELMHHQRIEAIHVAG
jgi:exopolyphosphatase/pppGpp-phosphohydrolase